MVELLEWEGLRWTSSVVHHIVSGNTYLYKHIYIYIFINIYCTPSNPSLPPIRCPIVHLHHYQFVGPLLREDVRVCTQSACVHTSCAGSTHLLPGSLFFIIGCNLCLHPTLIAKRIHSFADEVWSALQWIFAQSTDQGWDKVFDKVLFCIITRHNV